MPTESVCCVFPGRTATWRPVAIYRMETEQSVSSELLLQSEDIAAMVVCANCRGNRIRLRPPINPISLTSLKGR